MEPHQENLEPLALALFMGTMSPDKIKHEIYSTKVMDYVEETRTIYGRSESRGTGQGSQQGRATGEGEEGTEVYPYLGVDPNSTSTSWSKFNSGSESQSHSQSHSEGETETQFPILRPIMGKELQSRQYESPQEQIFRAMVAFFDQKERQFVARTFGSKTPVSLLTP